MDGRDVQNDFWLEQFFLWYGGVNSGSTPWATLPVLFCEGFFCPGWLRIVILLISGSWVARITGVSHQLPAYLRNLMRESGRWMIGNGRCRHCILAMLSLMYILVNVDTSKK
jgi:hypothetical protein